MGLKKTVTITLSRDDWDQISALLGVAIGALMRATETGPRDLPEGTKKAIDRYMLAHDGHTYFYSPEDLK